MMRCAARQIFALILACSVVSLAACASTISIHADETVEQRSDPPNNAHARGVAFLLDHQNSDGSWGTFESRRPREIYRGTVASFRAFRDASTALCVMALIEPSRHDNDVLASLERGIDHMLESEPVGRATPTTFYNVWTHTYRVQAFARLLADDRFAHHHDALHSAVEAELSFLLPLQGADGGWGYYDFSHGTSPPSGIQSTSFNTASVLIALHELARVGIDVDERIIRDAKRTIERMHLPSGAYVYGTQHIHIAGRDFNLIRGSLARMQPCNLALLLFDHEHVDHATLASGLEQLREYHAYLDIAYGRPRPHEAWYQNSGYYILYGHFYAAVNATKVDAETGRDFLAWQSRMLARRQNPDGSWFDFPMYGYHRAYGTAFALLALQESLRDAAEE